MTIIRLPIAAEDNSAVANFDPGGDRLERLCARLLVIAKADSESNDPGPCLTALLRDELASIVDFGIREVTAKLRRELERWEATSEELRQLERCRYLALPEQFQTWTGEFARAKRQAESVIEALSRLGDSGARGLGRPASGSAACPAIAHPAVPGPERALAGWVEPSRPTDVASPQLEQSKDASPQRQQANGSVGLEDSTHPTQLSPTRTMRLPPVSIPAKRVPLAPVGVTLSLDCPSCGASGAVRCDRLGRLQVCRRCARSFRVDATGGLVEVVKRNDGRWVDRREYQRTATRSRAWRLLSRRVLPVLALAGIVCLGYRLISRPAPAQQPDLPRELEPRVELFTRAWLQKDWSLVRRFAAPGEDRALYSWFVRHPPPAQVLADWPSGMHVVLVSTQERLATVRVRIGNAGGTQARSLGEIVQFWQEHEAGWFFAPEGKSSGSRASASPALRSR